MSAWWLSHIQAFAKLQIRSSTTNQQCITLIKLKRPRTLKISKVHAMMRQTNDLKNIFSNCGNPTVQRKLWCDTIAKINVCPIFTPIPISPDKRNYPNLQQTTPPKLINLSIYNLENATYMSVTTDLNLPPHREYGRCSPNCHCLEQDLLLKCDTSADRYRRCEIAYSGSFVWMLARVLWI